MVKIGFHTENDSHKRWDG